MSQTFLSTFCGAPVVPKIQPLTEKEVIDHFTSYIEQTCKDECTIVKYSMPKEFYGRINSINFWQIICSFLSNQMKFKIISSNYFGIGMLFECDYNLMSFKTFYCVSQRESSQHGEYFMQDYNCKDYDKIDFVVFRIYKANH
jgi:hypothetical protein